MILELDRTWRRLDSITIIIILTAAEEEAVREGVLLVDLISTQTADKGICSFTD